jgi:hypothetical protein
LPKIRVLSVLMLEIMNTIMVWTNSMFGGASGSVVGNGIGLIAANIYVVGMDSTIGANICAIVEMGVVVFRVRLLECRQWKGLLQLSVSECPTSLLCKKMDLDFSLSPLAYWCYC